jgi:hypothetical protein
MHMYTLGFHFLMSRVQKAKLIFIIHKNFRKKKKKQE